MQTTCQQTLNVVLHGVLWLGMIGCSTPASVALEMDPSRTEADDMRENASENSVDLAPGISINKHKGEVRVQGHVALRQGFLEQLVCFKGTREHESLIVVDVEASQIHAALLAVGALPGHPGQWSRDKTTVNDLTLLPPAGDGVRVQVQYEMDGVIRVCDLTSWIQDARHREEFDPSFVFAGSRFEPDGRGGQRYKADATGSIVGLVTFGDELVAHAHVIPDQAGVAQPQWQARTDRIPRQGSEVVLILKAIKP